MAGIKSTDPAPTAAELEDAVISILNDQANYIFAGDDIATYGDINGDALEYATAHADGTPVIPTPAHSEFRYTRHHVNADGSVELRWRLESGHEDGTRFDSEEYRDRIVAKWYDAKHRSLPEPTRDTPKPMPSDVMANAQHADAVGQPSLCDLRDNFGIHCTKPHGHALECRTPMGHRFNSPQDPPKPNAVTMGGVTLDLPTQEEAKRRRRENEIRAAEMRRGTNGDRAGTVFRRCGFTAINMDGIFVGMSPLDERITASRRERGK